MLRVDRNEVFMRKADAAGRAEMRSYVESMRGFLDVGVIGRSILSREIEAFSVGSGEGIVLLVAAHHAMESITSNLAYLLMHTLLGGMTVGSVNGVDCKFLLSKYRYMIVPCVNPDGVEMRCHGVDNSPLKERQLRMSGGDFSTWQANARGVDLNHNYDHRFREYKALEGERGISCGRSLYSGEYPESEPETRSVVNLVRSAAPIAVVSLHSQGEEIYAYPENQRVVRAAKCLSALSAYSFSAPADTAAYGGLCDYTATLGIPSFTYEVGKGENPLSETLVFDIFDRIAAGIIILPTLL